ncbi:murein hydrolase activator EnvC family protein [Pararhodonellum marinum]|uniref:murein hydrolase activator EnvC family protein n=1 Tax=Pararhodonellum marinum TaxID=2755358 RepID=UPI00188F8CC5|nr:peptidoglycan DD-metalloendopeptidase family protein [Pararhodonellum marinum]
MRQHTSFLFFTLLITGLLLLGSVDAFSQTKKSRAQLEKEKAEIQKRLVEFDKILKQTASKKKNTLGELNAVNKKLETRVSFINTLNREVRLINQEISETEKMVKSLENDLKNLKEEYSKMIYTSAKLNSGVNIMTFVFSSANFKQFYMRLKYLRQYSEARKKQVDQIEKVNEDLALQRIRLEDKKVEKQLALNQEQAQKKELDVLKKQQQDIVKTLSQKEEDLKKQIAAAKKQQEQLNKMITMVIEEEIRLAEASAKKEGSKATKTTGSSMPMTPEAAALSNSFAGNKGRIPWPVTNGFISKRYGSHPHPTLKGITVDNDGVDIQTNPNSEVRAVFDGVVTKITSMPGYGGTIIIKHGEYYTMYSKLKTISVKNGQSIKATDKIGTVYTDKEGLAEVHFQTWKGLQVMDPSIWLATK